MARYNTVISSASVSAGTTLNTPGQGTFTEITTSGITVQLPNPALYAGSTIVFYNSSSGSSTISTSANGGNIVGPGLTSANSQSIGTNGTASLYSDGINWIQTFSGGGPIGATTISASGQITSTVTTGTAPFVVASTTNVANLNASSLNGATFASPGAIGGGTASSGTFTAISGTTITGSSTLSLTGSGLTHSISSATASTTTGTGALTIGGGLGVGGQVTCATIVETSSLKFKENITPIDNALSSILKLKGVTYDRKEDKKHEVGLIAEHVFKVIPDVVSLDEKGKPYGIQYTKLTAYLIESIKSLQAEIDELKGIKINDKKKPKGK